MSELLRPVADDVRETTRIGRFVTAVEREHGLTLPDYAALHRWSVAEPEVFWSAVAAHLGVRFDTPPRAVLGRREMPGAQWFPGATLNYAAHALDGPDDHTAVVAYSQTRDRVELTWAELREQVARARAGLRRLGVGRGDRVAAYLPNLPETVVAFLATASLGAVWTSCAPEFGARSVLDRFGQVDPIVLLTVGGYGWAGRDVDRRDEVAALRAGLPGVRHVVAVPYGPHTVPDAMTWDALLATDPEPGADPVPFDHPLCVLFSSGTTGLPKAIVHGHGGILLEHLKNHALSWDLGPGDRILWYSTTAWMMWNALVSGLLRQASIVLIDGNPAHPDLGWHWRLAAETGATLLGASPGFLMASRAAGLRPAVEHDLSAVRQIGAAGSPLPPEGYRWVTEQFGPDVLLNVGSGGTDVCSGIVQGSPFQPVRSGEISGPCLGVDAAAFDDAGRPVVGELGELVIRAPCRRCRSASGATTTAAATATPTSPPGPGCGGTATGSASPPTGPRSSPAAPTPPSTGAASGWGRPSSTASWRSCPRSRTRSSCTWRTPPAATASCCCSCSPPATPPSTTPWSPASAPRCAASSPRATSRTGSRRCRSCRATAPARSWRSP